MSGGIAIILLLILVVVGVIAYVSLHGSAQALRHRPGGDLGPQADTERRPVTKIAEPTDEHAAGYGVGGEHEQPRPARVPRES